MTTAAEQICPDLLALPEADRAELARVLLESLSRDNSDETETHWENELARREDDIRSGRVSGISEEEFFARLDTRLSVGR